MQLVEIRENAVTLELDWADVKYLTYIIRHAIVTDFGHEARDHTMFVTYAETVEALLLAAGMASWAGVDDGRDYTLERFADVVQLTPEEERRWRERCAEAQREYAAEQARKAERPPAA